MWLLKTHPDSLSHQMPILLYKYADTPEISYKTINKKNLNEWAIALMK